MFLPAGISNNKLTTMGDVKIFFLWRDINKRNKFLFVDFIKITPCFWYLPFIFLSYLNVPSNFLYIFTSKYEIFTSKYARKFLNVKFHIIKINLILKTIEPVKMIDFSIQLN